MISAIFLMTLSQKNAITNGVPKNKHNSHRYD